MDLRKDLKHLKRLGKPEPKVKKLVKTKYGGKTGRKKRYSQKEKELLGLKAIQKLLNGKTVEQIALSLNLSKSVLYRLLSNEPLWELYKQQKRKSLQAGYMELSSRLIKEAIRRIKAKEISKVKFKDLVVSSAISHDKVYPQASQEISVGKKQINVSFSNWHNNPFNK